MVRMDYCEVWMLCLKEGIGIFVVMMIGCDGYLVVCNMYDWIL